MNIRRHLPFFIAVLLLGVTAGFVLNRKNVVADDALPLRGSLDTLPEQIGPYVKVGSETMDEDTLKMFGSNDYILWVYHDTRVPIGEPGSGIRFHVGYWSGTKQILSTGLHAPEICYVGGGANVVSIHDHALALNKRMPQADGSERRELMDNVPLRLFQYSAAHSLRASCVGYFFNMNSKLLASTSLLRAYTFFGYTSNLFYSKIEIMPGTLVKDPESGLYRLGEGEGDVTAAKAKIKDFLEYAYPYVEEKLPAR